MSTQDSTALNALNADTAHSEVLTALKDLLGAENVLTGDALATRHTADWSDAPAVAPLALLLPRECDEVAKILAICHRFDQPIAIQGGLTGLAGGANPQPGEIALSLQRLNRVEDFDEMGGTVLVQAGVTLEQLQTVAAERGWFFPLDLGARGSCQVGGNVATNAGGNRVLRFGMMRQAVLGLEVALADGTVISRLDRVIKNNAGFDLKQLFIGSEGSLGVITRLSLKLEPARAASCTVLCGLQDFPRSAALLRQAKAQLPDLTAFELMWQGFFEASAAANQRALPFSQAFPLYVLIETQGADAASCEASVERFLESVLEDGTVDDAIIAQSGEQAKQLWAYREGVSELLSLKKPCAAFDVSVALPAMNDLVAELEALLQQRFSDRAHLFFGHLGDGNLHLISGPYPDAAQMHEVEELVYRCVGRFDGSISAEHGIGLVKKPFLDCSRSPEEIRLMAGLKQLLDPAGILNRGRIFDGARAKIG